MLTEAPTTKSATFVAVCGGWRSEQEEAEDILLIWSDMHL